jgi:SPP1 family predicted phage head-tail adaptor
MRPTLNAGEMNQRVTLLQPTVVEDAHGQEVQTFAPVATVWAAPMFVRTEDHTAAQALDAVAEHRLRLRYRADVLGTWRLQWRGATFEVVGQPVDVGGYRTALDLLCRSVTV